MANRLKLGGSCVDNGRRGDADLPDDDAIVVVTWPGGAQRCVVVESGAIVVRKATDDE